MEDPTNGLPRGRWMMKKLREAVPGLAAVSLIVGWIVLMFYVDVWFLEFKLWFIGK